MACKILINIRNKNTKLKIRTLYYTDTYPYSTENAYLHAIDIVQNYFQRYIKPFEINEGTKGTRTHRYWNISPQKQNTYATIVIDTE